MFHLSELIHRCLLLPCILVHLNFNKLHSLLALTSSSINRRSKACQTRVGNTRRASASLVANNSNAAAAEASAGVSMIDGRAIVALYAYTGTNVDEIDLVVDEPLTILNAPDNDEGWITVQNAAGMQGVVPEAYVGPDDGVGAEDGGDDGDDGDFVVVNDAPVAVILPVPAYAPVSALDADALARAAEAQAPKPPT